MIFYFQNMVVCENYQNQKVKDNMLSPMYRSRYFGSLKYVLAEHMKNITEGIYLMQCNMCDEVDTVGLETDSTKEKNRRGIFHSSK